jgi:hypothetical protein
MVWYGSGKDRMMIRKLGRWKMWIRLYVLVGGVYDYGMVIGESSPPFCLYLANVDDGALFGKLFVHY